MVCVIHTLDFSPVPSSVSCLEQTLFLMEKVCIIITNKN